MFGSQTQVIVRCCRKVKTAETQKKLVDGTHGRAGSEALMCTLVHTSFPPSYVIQDPLPRKSLTSVPSGLPASDSTPSQVHPGLTTATTFCYLNTLAFPQHEVFTRPSPSQELPSSL